MTLQHSQLREEFKF